MTMRPAYPRALGWRHLAVLVMAALLLAASAARMDLGRLAQQMVTAVLAPTGLAAGSPETRALGGMIAQLAPIQLSDRRDVTSIADFDPDRLPPFAYLETTTETRLELDPDTLVHAQVARRTTWLVQPFGYAWQVAGEMLETIEIALWGTIVAIILSLPLALLGARPLMPQPIVRNAARSICAALRAFPELLSALFLVAAFGFGPGAGILALGIHAAGYLGRTFADAIEDADQRPLQAVQATGANGLVAFRMAVLPQVKAPFVSATFYILDRNVRTATVVGLVGAGGIGQELKGRIDLFEYGHVGTILIAILITVLLLDRIAIRLRHRGHVDA